MTNESRVPAGVPTGGQFAASAKAEADVALAPHLASRVVDQTLASADGALVEALEAARTARVTVNRLTLAQRVVDMELPARSTISLVRWPEEPNEDGTYDIDLAHVYNSGGQEVCAAFGGQGAIPAGCSADGSTDWDDFLDEHGRVEADKVLAWLKEEHGIAVAPARIPTEHELNEAWGV